MLGRDPTIHTSSALEPQIESNASGSPLSSECQVAGGAGGAFVAQATSPTSAHPHVVVMTPMASAKASNMPARSTRVVDELRDRTPTTGRGPRRALAKCRGRARETEITVAVLV